MCELALFTISARLQVIASGALLTTFCSIQALSDLRELGIGGAETTRHNYKHFPDRLRQAKKQGAVAPCAVESATVMNVNVVLWSDAKIVSMLSTVHSVEGEDAWEPKIRRKPRSGPSAPLFGEPREMKKMPKLVDDYNKHIGGCDIVDQMRTYYSTKLTARRNWLPLFFGALTLWSTTATLFTR